MGKISSDRYELKAVKSPSDMLPLMTKCPPSARMVSDAILPTKVTTGIRVAKSRRIAIPLLRACVLASRNLLYSGICAFSTRTSMAPVILSLMMRLSQSTISLLRLKYTFSRLKTSINAMEITGNTASTARASCQSMEISSALAPMIINSDEATATMAIETNIFTESASEVRLVSSLEGLTC